ncbi:MAG: NAD(P)H-dependent glycerol-3-phosphate dehydrogenase [Rhizobiaceae bacterium]
MSISVLGCGAWGTALASMLADQHEGVLLWGRNAKAITEINEHNKNSSYLYDVQLSAKLIASDNLAHACQADTLLCVTPAQSFSELTQNIAPLISDATQLVLCAKGIDQKTGQLLHEIADHQFGKERVAALSGPSFASDVAKGLPTAVSLAAHNLKTAQALASKLSSPRFRIYASDDLIGVEAGGALKNVLAIAVGVARGLQLGASAEAALIARGFAELNRITIALGARRETMAGLSGLGDLVLTCSSTQSRNFSYGIALAKQEDLSNRPLAEGVHSAKMALQLAQKYGVDTPIIEMVTALLEHKITPSETVALLLSRPLKDET